MSAMTFLHLLKLGKMVANDISEGKREEAAFKLELEKKRLAITAATELTLLYPKYEQYMSVRNITESPVFRTVFNFEERNEIWKTLRKMEGIIADSGFGSKENFIKEVEDRATYLHQFKSLEWECPKCKHKNQGDTIFYKCENCREMSPESVVLGNEKLLKTWIKNFNRGKTPRI